MTASLEQRIGEALRGDSVADTLARILREAPPRADGGRRAHGGAAADTDDTRNDVEIVTDVRRALTAPDAGAARTADDDAAFALDAVLNTVKDAIIAVDSEARIVSVNMATTRVFDRSPVDLEGCDVAELIPALGDGTLDLAALGSRVDDTAIDLAPRTVETVRASGQRFTAEMTCNAVEWRGCSYVLCLRDVTDKLNDVAALRDSEARYRTLVENAPEAILVFDVDAERFVDANENAERLFGMSREALLEIGPARISPEHQSDGSASFGQHRGHIEEALQGGRPVFEWQHCDVDGREFPCEVRFVQLPSSHAQLIRASVIDITARRRADLFAVGERRVLELVAANASLERTLRAVVELAEQMHPELYASIAVIDDEAHLELVASAGLPKALTTALERVPVDTERPAGTCAAAAARGRQVVTRALGRAELWQDLREAAAEAGVAACCSTPIAAPDGRVQGTLGLYYATDRAPTRDELDLAARLTQLAGIAIRRKQDETALRESEARYRGLFDNVVDGVFQSTPDGELLSANPALLRMLGCADLGELQDFRAAERFEDPRIRGRLMQELETLGRVRNYEYRLKRPNGSLVTVVENSRLVADETGTPLYCEGTITDITQRKSAEHALYEEKERAEVTLKSIGDAVLTTDAQGCVAYLNPVAEQLTGWERRGAAGRGVEEVVRLRDETSGEALEAPVLRSLREGRVVNLVDNAVLVARDGTTVAIQDSAAPIRDGDGHVVGAVMVFHDVSQARQLHRRLAYHANHDSLTGLINRREFEERLSAALAGVNRGHSGAYSLLYLDLDQFKVINDTCGHAAGDLLLRQLGELLQEQMRENDVLARLGGDEFAVLLAGSAAEEATATAERLREAVADYRFVWRDSSMQVGVSIGIVPVEGEADDIGALLSAADVACYVAKDLGRNRIHIYEEGDAAERHQEMQWVARVNRAREEERLELFFQPIVPTRPGAAGDTPQFELLLRMRDEQGGLIEPTAFIPAAERYNLMASLDRWVVGTVLESLAYRESMGCEPYMLAVNLSGATLNDPRFVDYLIAELERSDVATGSLCFEITETAAIANLGSVVTFMGELKSRGCRFSLDDFGTGLSSLTYLKNLPVDYVKIDGQFIRNVVKDKTDETVVDAIARMARAFEIRTIAERVETRAALTRLAELGIDYAQGHFIAVPRPVSELPVTGRRQASA